MSGVWLGVGCGHKRPRESGGPDSVSKTPCSRGDQDERIPFSRPQFTHLLNGRVGPGDVSTSAILTACAFLMWPLGWAGLGSSLWRRRMGARLVHCPRCHPP